MTILEALDYSLAIAIAVAFIAFGWRVGCWLFDFWARIFREIRDDLRSLIHRSGKDHS